ncbi:MAG: hypothetical protein ACJ76D_00535 [Solirubrobacterales bacterium]
MEALLEKEGDVESWNDDRLDEFSRRMDKGFEATATKVELTAVKNEMGLRFGEVDRRLDEVTSGLLYLASASTACGTHS